MSSAYSILSRALSDNFREVSNAISLAQGFMQTLYTLTRATNRAFEQGERSVGGAWHYILDINEAGRTSPLKPEGKEDSLVVFLNLHDTCKSDLRKTFAPLPEPGLLLVFRGNGLVTATATKTPLPDEWTKKFKPSRSEEFRINRPNALEDFVASWLRTNLDAKTLVEIQNQMEIQDQKDADNFWVWTPEQRDRLFFPNKNTPK